MLCATCLVCLVCTAGGCRKNALGRPSTSTFLWISMIVPLPVQQGRRTIYSMATHTRLNCLFTRLGNEKGTLWPQASGETKNRRKEILRRSFVITDKNGQSLETK